MIYYQPLHSKTRNTTPIQIENAQLQFFTGTLKISKPMLSPLGKKDKFIIVHQKLWKSVTIKCNHMQKNIKSNWY